MMGWAAIIPKFISWQNKNYLPGNMKRNYPLLIFMLAFISIMSGLLTSGVSFVGRLGINFFYKEYKFFKSWWQSALVCFAFLLLVLLLLYFIDKKLKGSLRQTVLTILLLAFLTGLYITFRDFRKDLSHRWLGERFHLGIYLYWLGAAATSLFFIATKQKIKEHLR